MTEGLAEVFNKKLQRRNFSLREAAEEIGVSHATLSRLLSGKTRLGFVTCAKLARFLRLRVARVLELAGHAETGTLTGMDDPLLEDFVGTWQELREEDKRFVSRVIQTLLDDATESE